MAMSHIPVNHPLRPLYRAVSAVVGLYVLLFGIVGFVQTRGTDPFAQPDVSALGLPTNQAFSVLSVVVGAVILVATFIGRNIDRAVYLGGSVVFLLAGTVKLALLHTDLNFLNFSPMTCIMSYLIGTLLLTAGLYGKVAPAGPTAAEDALGQARG